MLAQQQAWEVEQARRRMERDHIVNMAGIEARNNVLGGWRVDANGQRYYKEGYL
jgi:hypothetical protein